MDRIWAPWRGQYVRGSASERRSATGCFFCDGLGSDRDRENLVVWRRPASVVFLNRFPYNTGHLLVAPIIHTASLVACKGSQLIEPIETIQSCVDILTRILSPEGFNVGLNLGKSAGAGVPGHLHWHIVPRWDGDTNFLPVVSDTKVMVESLEGFYERFQAELPL